MKRDDKHGRRCGRRQGERGRYLAAADVKAERGGMAARENRCDSAGAAARGQVDSNLQRALGKHDGHHNARVGQKSLNRSMKIFSISIATLQHIHGQHLHWPGPG